MNQGKREDICEEAECYYLSLAFGDEYGSVPSPIASHVESCSYCQRQLHKLKEQLQTVDMEEPGSNRFLAAHTQILGLHFVYLGKEVGCDIVKPFLPSLLTTSLKIGIPTPITMHIDRCKACMHDLAIIKAMDLSVKQLEVLNLILSSEPSVSKVECSVAAATIGKYVNFDLYNVDREIIKHLCCCSVCQMLIYKARAEKIKNLKSKDAHTSFPCDSVTFSDVFDYCFPYRLASFSDQYANFRKPLTDELKQCPRCLRKVQELHQQVYAIKQRPKSGIVTVYEIGETQKAETMQETQAGYGDFNINVKTLDSVESRASSEDRKKSTVKSKGKSYIYRTGFKRLSKIAAAAVVIFVVALFLRSTPTASALNIQQVYDAIQEAANIYIQQFTAEQTEPLQEKWVSKELGIYAAKDESGFVIWNTSDKTKYIKPTGSQNLEAVSLPDIQTTSMQKRIKGMLGLMPFENPSAIPRDSKWRELDASGLENVSADTQVQVYELSWTKRSERGATIYYQWRGFIEKTTNRPLRVEFYRHDIDSTDYELKTIHLVEYWTKNQMEIFLKKALP